MNLHGIVSGAIGSINPFTLATLKVSTGSTTSADGTQVPTYAADVTISAQVQPLTGGDLRQMEGLNLQGNFVGIYCNGNIQGLVRTTGQGGDLIVIASGVNAGTWLVKTVLETWPNWCKTACSLQNGS